MKAYPVTHYSMNPLRSVPKNAAEKKDTRSPYLKAVLSGTNNKLIASKMTVVGSDKDAALRYIRESRSLQKK